MSDEQPTRDELIEANAKLTATLVEARGHIQALRDEWAVADFTSELPARALHLSILSHGEAPGEKSDACFTARASHFLKWLREAADPSGVDR